jgi:hypothetical protein
MADNTELSNFNCFANFKSSPFHDNNLFAIFSISTPKKNEVETKKSLHFRRLSLGVPPLRPHAPTLATDSCVPIPHLDPPSATHQHPHPAYLPSTRTLDGPYTVPARPPYTAAASSSPPKSPAPGGSAVRRSRRCPPPSSCAIASTVADAPRDRRLLRPAPPPPSSPTNTTACLQIGLDHLCAVDPRVRLRSLPTAPSPSPQYAICFPHDVHPLCSPAVSFIAAPAVGAR